jgi:hypothetical protein
VPLPTHQSTSAWECPECRHSLRSSLNRLTKPKSGEPSVCGYCGAFVIFTADLELRALNSASFIVLNRNSILSSAPPSLSDSGHVFVLTAEGNTVGNLTALALLA